MMGTIVSNLESILIFVAVLSILIVVHEWGHFITAKRLGVKVQRFALGFGPTLFSKEFNGTMYMINAIPLGGYVKMAGDERSECVGNPEEFYSKSVGHRSLVVLNGPLVNFVLAYLSFVLVFMIGYPGQSTKISGLVDGGPAALAGLQLGDKIVAVNSKGVYGWLNLQKRLEGNDAGPMEVTVVRDQQVLTRTLQPSLIHEPNLIGRDRMVRDLGIDYLPNIVGGFVEGSSALAAGVMAGDQVIEIDGKKTEGWSQVKAAVVQSNGQQIVLKILRQGQILTKMVMPQISTYEDDKGRKIMVRKIGIGPEQEFDQFKFGLFDALIYSGEELAYITGLTYESLYRMMTGAISAKETMTGPVGIFFIVKGAAESGIAHLLFILGVISASLAIFNLLPIIPLDGGHLFLFAVEKVRGRALPPKVDEYIARAGFAFILLLAAFVFYNDFSRFGWLKQMSVWFGHFWALFH